MGDKETGFTGWRVVGAMAVFILGGAVAGAAYNDSRTCEQIRSRTMTAEKVEKARGFLANAEYAGDARLLEVADRLGRDDARRSLLVELGCK